MAAGAEEAPKLAPEVDPPLKAGCCTFPCWLLWGLLGLTAVTLGLLFGLGVFGNSYDQAKNSPTVASNAGATGAGTTNSTNTGETTTGTKN